MYTYGEAGKQQRSSTLSLSVRQFFFSLTWKQVLILAAPRFLFPLLFTWSWNVAFHSSHLSIGRCRWNWIFIWVIAPRHSFDWAVPRLNVLCKQATRIDQSRTENTRALVGENVCCALGSTQSKWKNNETANTPASSSLPLYWSFFRVLLFWKFMKEVVSRHYAKNENLNVHTSVGKLTQLPRRMHTTI